MSLNQLIRDKQKNWLNVRVNNLTVDGSTNIPGSDHYDSSNNSFQATNQTTERPSASINIGGVVDNSGDINSVVLLGFVNGNNNISIGDCDVVGNNNIALGNSLDVVSSNSIVLSNNTLVGVADNQIVIGNNNNPQGQGQRSIVFGFGNVIRSLNEPNNTLVIGVDNDLGHNIDNMGEKFVVIGFNNNVSDLIETSNTENCLVVGSDNNMPETKKSIVLGKGNTISGERTDCIVVGEGNTVSNDNEMVIGSSNITNVKIKNLAIGSSGSPVFYNSGTGELVYNNSPVFSPASTQSGVVNVSAVGNFTINFFWEFSKIEFQLLNNGVYSSLYDASGGVGSIIPTNIGAYYKVLYLSGATITTEMAFETPPNPLICFKAINGAEVCVIEFVSRNSSSGTFNCSTYTGFPAGLQIIYTAWE